jgi:3-deoxy-D-manno-octulosonate 8-phosphate phosphatase (KDO 8-P phosphatase)
MTVDLDQIKSVFKGNFIIEPGLLRQKLSPIRAIVFDWDGVFNDGIKNENGSSSFSEVDAMGTNLLRFNHYLQVKNNLFVAIISGEKNPLAFSFARREHFNEVYYKVRHKAAAINHLCQFNHLQPEEIAFIFDDVLDFSAAKICGVRIMVGRDSNPLLADFAVNNNLVDYITFADGGQYAVRESAELIMALSGQYEQTIRQRMEFSDGYKHYWQMRNLVEPLFYTTDEAAIIHHSPQTTP